MEITIKKTFNITDEQLDDIMCTALEGGITYWCDEAKVVGDYLGEYAHEQIARGGQPIMINSALVSAQSRKRCYWTNIPGITQPKDRGILLKDVLERGGVYIRDKAYTLRASAPRKLGESNVLQHIKTNGHFGYQGVLEPISVLPINGAAEGKARTLKAQYHKTGIANFVTNGGFGATGVAEQYDQSAGSTVYKVEDKKNYYQGRAVPR